MSVGSSTGRVRATDSVITGTLTGPGQTVTLLDVSGHGMAAIGVEGSYTGWIHIEVSVDGTNFWSIAAFDISAGQYEGPGGPFGQLTGVWVVPIAGARSIRAFAVIAGGFTGTATVTIRANQAADSLPAYVASNVHYWVPRIGDHLDGAIDQVASSTVPEAMQVAGRDGSNLLKPLRTDTNGELQIDVLTSALPAGAATFVEQQTQTASLSVLDDWDETDRAKVNLIAGQAGIQGGGGTVTANTPRVAIATDANDVDVLSIIPGTGATNLGKAEDTAHTTGDTGVMALGVRRDTLAAGAGTDGDYEALPIANILSTLGVPMHIVGTILLPVASDVANGAALNSTSAIPVAGPDQTTGNKGNIESAAAAVTTSTARGMVVRQQGIPTSTALSDTISNPTTQHLGAMQMIYNGSTWSRRRQTVNALNSTGTGIADSALVAQLDDTSPTTITENQFGHLRMSPQRSLKSAFESQGRSDTFTAAANGTAIDLGAGTAYKSFALQVVQTGTVTSWTVVLEGSLDGTNFSTILTHTNAAPGSGGIVPLTTAAAFTPFPVRYYRSRCSAIVLGAGTNVIATILGVP